MKPSEFVKKVLNLKGNLLDKISIIKVTREQANRIKESTGFDLTGYTHVIDSFGVKHTLKNHGNPKKESQRGQIAVTAIDFDRIKDVVTNFDEVKFSGKNISGRNLIRYIKKINGYIIYVEEIRSPKNKEVTMQTMWIVPKKKSLKT